MGEVNREHVPEIGGEIWLVDVKRERYPRKFEFQGQTSRSWVVGHPCRPSKMAKKDYAAISAEEAAELNSKWRWMSDNRPKIMSRLSNMTYQPANCDVFRQIAALIGYEEGK